MTATFRQAVEIIALDEFRDFVVECLFLIGRLEGVCQGLALGIADVFGDVAAEGAFAEVAKALLELFEITTGAHVLGGESGAISEDIFIDEGGEAEDFKEGILEGGGGEQDFFAIFERVSDGLTGLIAGAVAVAEFMGFIDDGEIERDAADFVLVATGKRVGADEYFPGVKGAWVALFFQLAVGGGVEDLAWEVEFLVEFQGPLFAD